MNQTLLYVGIMIGLGLLGTSLISSALAQQNATITVPTEELLSNTVSAWTAIIGSAISLILIILKWFDSIMSKRKDSAQKTKLLEVSGKLQDSLKQTDAWIRDTIIENGNDIKTFIGMISKYPTVQQAVESPEVNQFMQRLNAKGLDAKTEFDRWYNYASSVTGLDSKDPIVSGGAKIEEGLSPAGPEPDEEINVIINTKPTTKPKPAPATTSTTTTTTEKPKT